MNWISVKDYIPELMKDVLVYDASKETMAIGSLWKNGEGKYFWKDSSGWMLSIDSVTHWMLLPELPKEGE